MDPPDPGCYDTLLALSLPKKFNVLPARCSTYVDSAVEQPAFDCYPVIYGPNRPL